MKSGRKDHKNRLLRAGESQDKEGRYRYSYYENGKQKSFYSWKLEPTDKLPAGKKGCVSLREQKNYEVIRENELRYLKAGDYFISDLKLPEENRHTGKYGCMHRDYLQEHNPIMFNDLVLEGKLWTYLADLNEQAQNRLSLIIKQMQEDESVRNTKNCFG